MQKAALYAAGAIFAVGTFVHLIRLLTGFTITVDGFAVPVWLSGPGLRPHHHPNGYGAFVLDPDGNNVEAAGHRPE